MEKGFYYDNEGNRQEISERIQKKVSFLKKIERQEKKEIETPSNHTGYSSIMS